ncbi:hypothetical protein T06_5817 [Trichinella sp. T6]|nr:hypothetical protein T06_5817 [Trichinella sp. T6]
MAKEFSPIFAYKQRNLFLNGIEISTHFKYLSTIDTYEVLNYLLVLILLGKAAFPNFQMSQCWQYQYQA